jgi:hypothetical protein
MGLLAIMGGCGSNAVAGQQDATVEDAPTSSDAQDAVVADAADAPDGAGGQLVVGWLARGFSLSLSPMDAQLEQQLRENAAGLPPEGRLIFLLRLEDLSETQARLTYGLGEPAPEGGSDAYRFLASSPPAIVPLNRYIEDGGPSRYVAYIDSVPFSIPVYPDGTDPPSTFSATVTPDGPYWVTVATGLVGVPWPAFEIHEAWVTQPMACLVYAKGINLLDALDGDPTKGIHGSTVGSFDPASCFCNCDSPNDGWRLHFFRFEFEQVTLLVGA